MNEESFLKNYPEEEDKYGISVNQVIVDKRDWEVVRSAVSFGRVKIMQGELFSNTNFLFELGEPVSFKNQTTIADSVIYKVVGRVDLDGYENSYLIAPITAKRRELGQENAKQLPESELVKYQKKS